MKPDPTILALDVATVTGYAVAKIAERKPVNGSQRISPPGSSAGYTYLQFAKWLTDMIAVHAPDIVIFESPLDPRHMGKGTNEETFRRLITLAGLVEMVCSARGITRVMEASVADVRQHFLGRRNMRGDEAKKAVLRKCGALGWNPRDNNAGDACALWSYAIGYLNGEAVQQRIRGL